MDIEKDYMCLEQNKKVLQKIIEVDESYQESLQAYCDDFYRIIKCTSHSYVTSVDINNNEVRVFGKTEICVTYCDEGNNLCYADFDEEFSKAVEVEGLSDSAFAVAYSKEKYCSFRVINQRRIDVHSAFVISLSVYDKQSCPCVSSCNNSKLRLDSIKTANVVGSNICRCEFDEEIVVSNSKLKRVVSAWGYTTIDDIKLIKDKALIKVNVCASLLYCCDDDSVSKYEHNFNISKIVDINGIDENDICITKINIGSLYFKVKNFSDNSSSIVQLYGDVVIASTFVAEKESKIVTDGYILNHNSNCEYSNYSCIFDGKYVSEDKQCVVNADFNSQIKEVFDMSVGSLELVIKNNKQYLISSVSVICKTSDDSITSFNTTTETEICACDYNNCISSVNVKCFDYNLLSDGKVDIRLTFKQCTYFYNEESINVLSEISATDDFLEYPALTIYFGKKEESVWNIAKSFSSDIDMIIKENELSSDVLDANKVLVIPGL